MENNSKAVLAALTGAVVGAGVALLLAPASGRETREKIANKLIDAKDAIADKGREARDKISDKYNDTKVALADKGIETLKNGEKKLKKMKKS